MHFKKKKLIPPWKACCVGFEFSPQECHSLCAPPRSSLGAPRSWTQDGGPENTTDISAQQIDN